MQQKTTRWVVALLFIAALPLSACSQSTEATEADAQPAKVEKVKGTSLKRVVLTSKAAERIGIETALVREVSRFGGDTARKVVDYTAIVYDAEGNASVYTNPEPLVFVRQPITVDYIDADLVVISDGPPVGTAVVVVGAEELLGAETGIGEFE